MAVKLTRLLALFCVFCVFPTTAGALDKDLVEKWAKGVGINLTKFFKNVTHYDELRQEYDDAKEQLSVEKKNGTKIADEMKKHLEGVLQKKIKSIKLLAAMTGELRENYTFDPSLKEVDYYNAKSLKGLELQKDPKFSTEFGINNNHSVVQIPTDVYSGGVNILNTVKWTAGLEKYFLENKKEEPSLLWQYFGSADGAYRIHPGFKWRDPGQKDMFDNRRRGWYIQGSSSPKDIVIMLDLRGSMLGSKLAIVKLAALSLLETLQENDFVHIVVVYKKIPNLICEAFDDGSEKKTDCPLNLMPATEQNTKFLKHFIPTMKASGIAAISQGIRKSIEILKDSRTKYNFTSSRCTQAIILFTDGIEDNEADETKKVLEEDNGDGEIRLFTYLVGREKGVNDKPLKEVCAKYRGCFFKIETVSDVREKVLLYVNALSRNLGLSNQRGEPSWTPIYLDGLGLGLMITIVSPVFNTTGDYEGGLLGVVGTDVALPELEDSVPNGEIGVNGYGFAINNNGFVLFHPGLRKDKNPPNIALDEVEYNKDATKMLMQRMIDRKPGHMTFPNRLVSDDKHWISLQQEYSYFYSPIENTSFSAAVAIPEQGLHFLEVSDPSGFSPSYVDNLNPSSKNEFVVVAPWKICSAVPIAAEDQTPVFEPSYATAEDILNDNNRDSHCVKHKLNHLLFDAAKTKSIAGTWDVVENDTRGIFNVFVATQGGIMRVLSPGLEESPFPRNYTKQQFYSQAAQYSSHYEPVVVFSAPYQEPDYRNENNDSLPRVTVSSAVTFNKDGKRTIVAVAGMQIDGESLMDLFLKSINDSKGECDEPEKCSLRLIDEDGFIVASNDKDKSEVGKFIGAIEGAVMRNLLNQSLYESLTFTNVQGECKKRFDGTSSARTLLNPLLAVSSYIQFWTHTVFWSLARFNLYSFFSGNNLVTAEENGGGDSDLVPCTNELKFFQGVWQNRSTSFYDRLVCSDGCEPFVGLAPVNGTNLRLLVVKNRCECDQTKLTTKPSEVVSDTLTTRFNQYRTPPIVLTPCDDFADKDKPPCAVACLSSPRRVFMAVALIAGLCLAYNDLWR